jgi:hypothetical protein
MLDLTHYCDTPNCEADGFRRIDRYEVNNYTIGIKRDTKYYLSILKLEVGYLEYQYWESDSYDEFPTMYKKATLDEDLSNYSSGKGRYEGYFTLPITGEYDFTIETNAVFTIYISDDSMITYQTSSRNFRKYFSQNEFYSISIEITLTDYTYFKIFATHDGSNFELSFYYPNQTKNSPIPISSCKASFVFEHKDEITGI